MTGEASTGGVLVSNGRCSLRLSRAGPANELGYPTLIDVQAGPFHGSILDETVRFEPFRQQIDQLYKTLLGIAKLASYEHFDLEFVGDGKGRIDIRVKVVGEHHPPIVVTFEFSIDQTYLPRIIEQIDTEFPPPYRVAI